MALNSTYSSFISSWQILESLILPPEYESLLIDNEMAVSLFGLTIQQQLSRLFVGHVLPEVGLHVAPLDGHTRTCSVVCFDWNQTASARNGVYLSPELRVPTGNDNRRLKVVLVVVLDRLVQVGSCVDLRLLSELDSGSMETYSCMLI